MRKILFALISVAAVPLSLSAQDNIDFADSVFAAPGNSNNASYYVDGGLLDSFTGAYDVLDANCSTTGGPDGVNDITISFEMFNGPNVYSGLSNLNTTRSTAASSGSRIQQSGSGINGQNNHGNNNASDAVTGDLVGYTVTVDFNGFTSLASDVNVEMTSINTAGEAHESTALFFRDASGNAYGSASYDGFWATPPAGATGGSGSPLANSNSWSSTGPGVFLADETVTTDVTSGNFTSGTGTVGTHWQPTAGADGANNNATVNALSTGLLATDQIGGFQFTVYFEDIASLDSNGDGVIDADETTTAVPFTSTLNSVDFVAIKSVPEPSSVVLLGLFAGGLALRRRK